jgi:primary-amine oxidase
LKADITGLDPSNWKVAGWVYDDVFYDTTQGLRQAFALPGFVRLSPNVEGEWSNTDQHGEVMPFDTLPPPVPAQKGPRRFSVDDEQRYVSWSK